MTIRIAIIGAGPAGLYTAQGLVRAVKDAEIDIIDQLPTPYGLIRYGIAPDHQGTKSVIRQFERLFEREGCRFFGHIRIGRDLPLEAICAAYDVVVVAAGLSGGRKLGIPGEDLPGVLDSGCITRWFNSHPAEREVPQIGRRPVIIGNGNVALDIARILAKHADEFENSDLDHERVDALAAEGVETIEVIGRSSARDARFDPALLKELAKLTGTAIQVDSAALDAGERNAVTQAFAEIAGHRTAHANRILRFRFGLVPVEISGEGGVSAVRFRDNEGTMLDLPATSVITAIGFQSEASCLLGRDALCAAAGEGAHAMGNIFLAGWFRTGPRGTVAEARREAKFTADEVVAWLGAQRRSSDRTGAAPLFEKYALSPFTYQDWMKIRAEEETSPPKGRVRRKITSIEAMRDLANGQERQAS